MTPISFGPPERRLFGLYYPGRTDASATLGVVLCNPFGQEAIRSHRFFRVLAERLARNGHAVLRFDYFGTGDSMGDDNDADLDGWAGDVHVAHKELVRRSGVKDVNWLGMRLGAAVAYRAAQSTANFPKRLILWDPVTDGTQYLAGLRDQHIKALDAALSIPRQPLAAQLAMNASTYQDEGLGFNLPELFRCQLASPMLFEPGKSKPNVPLVIVCDQQSADGRAIAKWVDRDTGQVTLVDFRHGTDWTSDSADNTALVPTKALMLLVEHTGSIA
jgi:uncharacterized protein